MKEFWFLMRTKSETDSDVFTLCITDGVVSFVSSDEKQWMIGKSNQEVKEYMIAHSGDGAQLTSSGNNFLILKTVKRNGRENRVV